MIRAYAIAAVFIALCSAPARSENLNQKFGSSWNCSYITAGNPLYDACKPCQDQNMDFWRDSDTTGHCVPRAGAQPPPPPVAPPPVAPPPPPTAVGQFYVIRACNETGRGTLYLTLAFNEHPGDVHATLRGWWSLAPNECKDLVKLPWGHNLSQVAFAHAQAGNYFWPRKVWPTSPGNTGTNVNWCIPMQRFERIAGPESSFSCPAGQEKRAFWRFWIEREQKPVTIRLLRYTK